MNELLLEAYRFLGRRICTRLGRHETPHPDMYPPTCRRCGRWVR